MVNILKVINQNCVMRLNPEIGKRTESGIGSTWIN